MSYAGPVKWLLLAGILCAVPGIVAAQEENRIARAEDIPDEKKIEFATQAVEEMRVDVREVSKMLETAEHEKDHVRIQCIGKKLTTMRALLEVSEISYTSLQSAVKNAEKERAALEYRKISIAYVKIRQFRSEAEACAGGSVGQTGTTAVQVMEAGLGTEEASEVSLLEFFEWEAQPPELSPFK